MRRPTRALLAMLAIAGLAACSHVPPKDRSQSLVDEARWTVEEFKERDEKPNAMFRAALEDARGVVVLPGVVKGGFVLGAEVGSGVLVARAPGGEWGYPAFYTLGGGSLGFQIGAQAADVILVLRSERAVAAVVEDQGKLGAELEVSMGALGAGLEAATTTNLGADIVAFSRGAGAYGGGTIEAAVLAKRKDLNEAYYEAGATPAAIVLEKRYTNARADGLRSALAVN